MAYAGDPRLTGRPPKYDNVEDLQAGIDKYFADCEEKNRPYTMQGLAIALDIHRDTLNKYSHEDIFSDTVIRAREKVQEFAERMLYDRNATNGAKFWLINNDTYTDRKEISMDANVSFVDDYGKNAQIDDD